MILCLALVRGKSARCGGRNNARSWARVAEDKEHAVSYLNSAIAVVGIDNDKNSFYVVGRPVCRGADRYGGLRWRA